MLQRRWDAAARRTRACRGASPRALPPALSQDLAISIARDPLGTLERIQRENGDVVGANLAGRPVIVVGGRDAIEQVLISKAASFQKQGTAFFPGSSLAGQGLLVTDGDVWARQRRLANPAFREAAVHSYSSAIRDATSAFLDQRWHRDGVRDLYDDFNALTLDVVARTLFGADLEGPDSQRITAAVATAVSFFAQRAASGFIVPESVLTPTNLQYKAAVAELDDVVYGLIRARRAAGAAAPKGDLMARLLSATDDSGTSMDDQSLRDELMTLLIAGQETSAIVLAWSCFFLARHPEWQDRAREEVMQLGASSGPTHEDVTRLLTVQAVLLESMRLMPPAYLVGRCAREDVQVGGFDVAAGTSALLSPYLLHRDVRLWQDPLSFDPSRWDGALRDAGGNAVRICSGMGPAGNYIPFGAGPRNCIGTGFALLEGILVLAMILQRHSLRFGAKFARPVEAQPVITLRPGHVDLFVARL